MEEVAIIIYAVSSKRCNLPLKSFLTYIVVIAFWGKYWLLARIFFQPSTLPKTIIIANQVLGWFRPIYMTREKNVQLIPIVRCFMRALKNHFNTLQTCLGSIIALRHHLSDGQGAERKISCTAKVISTRYVFVLYVLSQHNFQFVRCIVFK